jgi:hypothetical protein
VIPELFRVVIDNDVTSLQLKIAGSLAGGGLQGNDA